MHTEEREGTTYIVHNADTAPREVILEHPIKPGWKLLDEMKPEESSATRYRFRVTVGPGKTEEFTVKERRPGVSRIYVSSLSDNQLTAYVHDGAVKPELEAELRQVLAKKLEVFNVEQDLKSVQQEMESIDKDQSRLRENLKALKGSPEERALLQRYTKQLDGQEDRLATLRGRAADLKTKHNQLQSELDAMVMKLVIDETL